MQNNILITCMVMLFTTVLLASAISVIPTSTGVAQELKPDLSLARVQMDALNTATASFKEPPVPNGSRWPHSATVASVIIVAAMMPVLSIFSQQREAVDSSHDEKRELLAGTAAVKRAMAEMDQRNGIDRYSQLTHHQGRSRTKPFKPLKPRRASIPAAVPVASAPLYEVNVKRSTSSKRVSFGEIRVHEQYFVPTRICTHGVVIEGEWHKGGEHVCSVDDHENYRTIHGKPCKDEYLFEGRRSRKGPLQDCCVCDAPVIDSGSSSESDEDEAD